MYENIVTFIGYMSLLGRSNADIRHNMLNMWCIGFNLLQVHQFGFYMLTYFIEEALHLPAHTRQPFIPTTLIHVLMHVEDPPTGLETARSKRPAIDRRW